MPQCNYTLHCHIFTISSFLVVCTPACRNGGSCIFHNICQCPKNFVGNQCQYSVDRCAPHKIGFNGSVRCVGTSTSMSCTLTCPAGIAFDSPPATAYTCSFETGTFTPAKAPKCVYGKQFCFRCDFIFYEFIIFQMKVSRYSEGLLKGMNSVRE